MSTENKKPAVEERQEQQKESLIEQLRKTPVVQIACEKVGIGRATFYRWKKGDESFAKRAEEAVADGTAFINDMAESQLMAAIRDQNMAAIVFWLKHHHPSYATRVEVTAKLKREDDKLTPEQQAIVEQALRCVARLPEPQEAAENPETPAALAPPAPPDSEQQATGDNPNQ